MSDAPSPHLRWPALAGMAGDATPLVCERAIWGKVHGAASDFRWIAVSPSFPTRRPGVESEIEVGSEDAPERSVLWRTSGDVHYAAAFYPSRAVDAAGRSGLLEKQVAVWRRPPGVPAAVGALALLPLVATLGDETWWQHRGDPRWSEPDFALTLEPLASGAAALAGAVESAIARLTGTVALEALADLYAALLAGGRALPLAGLASPLAAEALAALLLPLPRERADALSVLGWLPSRRTDGDTLAQRWDLVPGGAGPMPAPASRPSDEQRREAHAMAAALFARDPARLDAGRSGGGSRGASRPASPPMTIPLVMWGPTAAGKTALLAQLFLRRQLADWEIFPTATALPFINQMRERIRGEHLFPRATPVQEKLAKIEYRFRHRATGAAASLVLEDRAGSDYEALAGGTRELLLEARGLVLLFDPLRQRHRLEREVAQTLEQMYATSGRDAQRDARPIAVCISKADLLIDTPADLDRAIHERDDFVRERVDPHLVELLDRYCANYRFFPLSAAGVRLRHGALEPVVFFDEMLAPRLGSAGEPFNLAAPFAWLLDQTLAAPS